MCCSCFHFVFLEYGHPTIFALDSWSIREMSPDAGGLPRYIVKALIPIAFTLLGLQVVEILRSIDALMAKEAKQ